MDQLFRLSFPYYQVPNSSVRLNKIFFTNNDDSETIRTSLSQQDKSVEEILHQGSKGQVPASYIENLEDGEKQKYPLLIKVDPELNKFKLHVSIKPTRGFRERNLLIVKSTGIEKVSAMRELTSDSTDSTVDVSKLLCQNLPIEDGVEEFQKLIINDSFDSTTINDKKVSVSLWDHDPASDEYSYLLHFSVWIDKLTLKESTESATNFSQVKSAPTSFSLGDFRREFSFSIEDGPEFRKHLNKLEETVPKMRGNYLSLIEDFRILESSVRRAANSKMKIIDGVNRLISSNSHLINVFGFKREFQRSFLNLFEPFETNINFFFGHVCDSKTLTKIMDTIPLPQVETTSQTELSQIKKQFEAESKEYYAWMNKYLANEKERPDSKLLSKRKKFELSKFDYLNQLSKTTNNQYANNLAERLFKFVNLPYNELHPRLLNFGLFSDNANFDLIPTNYQIYLFALTRFNSEKYQLRQKIEACQSNEELTTLIRHNNLNHTRSKATNDSTNKDIDEFMVTKENFDLIFSDIHPPSESHSSDTEMSGILFALSGPKNSGWHKEWVVLKNGQVTEYSDWRKGKSPISEPVEIALSSVKAVTHSKRQYCFEILTSSGAKHVFQAFDNDDRNKWVKALHNAAQLVDTERLEKRFGGGGTTTIHKKGRKNLGKVLIDFTSKPIIPGDGYDKSVSPVSIISKDPLPEKSYLHLVRSIPDSDNDKCVDCRSTESVEWVSINSLICMCVNCASCHRNIGSHISKVRSLTLDNFSNEMEMLLRFVNNRSVNAFMEENLSSLRIRADSDHETRLHFIRDKYYRKKYAAVLPDVNNLLIKSIQQIQVQGTIKAILCGADVNSNIQIKSTNQEETVVVSIFEYSLRKFIEVNTDNVRKKYFVLSELLVLNGCTNLGESKAPKADSGLSQEACDYWNLKKTVLNGS
ncbi:AGE1 [Candida theae]|uniref:ADP-ribosylation factor GTPase-activating protein n=1 Tax=Candida theae TaxID=1198502 RepID=A0AAD5G0X4_9ASCO|nr:AGE1 [Candida theae]KAI5967439.1 AGE1 [Candida theae]